jgi:hypothetical protein
MPGQRILGCSRVTHALKVNKDNYANYKTGRFPDAYAQLVPAQQLTIIQISRLLVFLYMTTGSTTSNFNTGATAGNRE